MAFLLSPSRLRRVKMNFLASNRTAMSDQEQGLNILRGFLLAAPPGYRLAVEGKIHSL